MRSARSSIWVWLTAISLGLVACGGSQDVSRPTGPVKKVAWDGSEAEPASDEPAPSGEDTEKKKAEPEDEEVALGDNVIDLDAPPAKAAAKPAPSAPPPEPEAPAAAEEEEAEEEEEPVAKAEPEPEAPSNDPLAAELRKRRAQAKARSDAKKEKAPPKKKKAKSAAGAEVATASYKGSDPCRASSFSVPRVREACASGGRAAAKRVMKDAIGKATATGQMLKCSSCHSNQRDYALKGDAVAELERWLETSSS
jgi:outer membrane biosynthesis protein TonB